MNVLVAGHSFVRHLAFDVKVRGLKFQAPGVRVHLQGKGGATICGPKPIDREIAQTLRSAKFQIVILELGSNDLDTIRHPNWDTCKLAELYVKKAIDLVAAFGVKVVLCLPIPRDETQFPGSFERTSKFNQVVVDLAKREHKVFTWAHKGLFKKDSRFLDRHGVHLNSKGSIRYFHSVKAAVKYHSSKFL